MGTRPPSAESTSVYITLAMHACKKTTSQNNFGYSLFCGGDKRLLMQHLQSAVIPPPSESNDLHRGYLA